MKKMFTALILGLLIAGCAEPQGNERLQEKAKIDAENQTDAEKTAQDERALAMEADLARLQNFFQGVRGIYEGQMKTKSGSRYTVRLSIHPNIERYEGSRIRTPDEIKYDLQNIAFDIEENTIARLSDGSPYSYTCGFSNIRPALDKGFFNLEGDGCQRSMTVNLTTANAGIVYDLNKLEGVSRNVADGLLSGKIRDSSFLQIEWRSINLPDGIIFIGKRVR